MENGVPRLRLVQAGLQDITYVEINLASKRRDRDDRDRGDTIMDNKIIIETIDLTKVYGWATPVWQFSWRQHPIQAA